MLSYLRQHLVFSSIVLVAVASVVGLGLSQSYLSTSVTAIPIADVCGNGILEGSEACDDGNLLNGDGCSNQCVVEVPEPPLPVCGNGLMEGEEACDDGNVVDGDGCSALCVVEPPAPPVPVCGNGQLEGEEACDDGNLADGDGCSALCVVEPPAPPVPVCGNGQLEGEEACDDGNLADGDGCSATCEVVVVPPPVLDTDGDGVLDTDDVCSETTFDNISLNPNQYAHNLPSAAFEYDPDNKQSGYYTMANAKGCSCKQIAQQMGIGSGHIKKGCSPGIMQNWTGIKTPNNKR